MKNNQKLDLPESSSRRNVLLGGAALTATLATGTAFAAAGGINTIITKKINIKN